MGNTILPKRRFTTGVPTASQLQQGEIAINLFDKKIYSKDINNNIVLLGSRNGDSNEKFKVATATANDEAVNKLQMENAIANVKQVTGTATFTNSSQTITLTGVGDIGLEIGDVIQISGSTSNNKEFLVETIVNSNSIRVNYEHRGQSTSKSLVNGTSSATVKLLAKWYNAGDTLGRGWCTPTTSRTHTAIYTNPFPNGLRINISVLNNAAAITNTVLKENGEDNIKSQFVFNGDDIVPMTSTIGAKNTYQLLGSGTPSIQLWKEFR